MLICLAIQCVCAHTYMLFREDTLCAGRFVCEHTHAINVLGRTPYVLDVAWGHPCFLEMSPYVLEVMCVNAPMIFRKGILCAGRCVCPILQRRTLILSCTLWACARPYFREETLLAVHHGWGAHSYFREEINEPETLLAAHHGGCAHRYFREETLLAAHHSGCAHPYFKEETLLAAHHCGWQHTFISERKPYLPYGIVNVSTHPCQRNDFLSLSLFTLPVKR